MLGVEMDAKVPHRVSCAAFVKFRIEDSLLGIVNRSRLASGTVVYTPPEAVYRCTGSVIPYFRSIGAMIGNNKELRFLLSGNEEQRRYALHKFQQWFRRRKNREVTPAREMYEELVEETQFLEPCTIPHDYRFKGSRSFRETTTRQRGEQYLTQYYLDLFEAPLSPKSQAIFLQQLQKQQEPLVRLISLEEIASGKTNQTIPIKGIHRTAEVSRLFTYFP